MTPTVRQYSSMSCGNSVGTTCTGTGTFHMTEKYRTPLHCWNSTGYIWRQNARERDRRLIPGIESSRFDSSQYVLISVKPGGTFLSWLLVLPYPPTRWNIDSSSLLLLLLPLSIGDCLVDLLSAPRRSRWYRLRTLHTRQNDYILYENVPTSR